jgi:cephalosporin-C deacetylase-like acetyl esterase
VSANRYARPIVALCLLASAGAQEPSVVDRYLTAVARNDWTARDARIAAMRAPAEVEQRQAFVRSKIVELLGGFPERTPLNPRITGSFVRDGYRVEKLIFESRPKFFVTADIYVPSSGHPRYPAVLGVAGHSLTSKAEPVYQRGWISLAKRGFLVLAFDPPGQGERSLYYDPELRRSRVALGTAQHTMAGLPCILTGSSLANYEVWDGIRAFDYLLTRSDVDPKRIAVAGNSGGGTQSAYLAALEPRLASAAPSCFLNTSEKLWTDLGPQDAEQNIIGFLASGLDLKDFALAFAPRPFQFLTATRDFFSIAGAHDAFAEARHIYEIMGHPERVNFFEFNDTHGWSQPRREATYRWFQKWLNDQPLDQGAETQFEVEAESNLWVTPTGQVAASLQGETVQSLNAQLAERLVKQRPHLGREDLRRAIANRIGLPAVRRPVAAHGSGETIELETEEGVRIPARIFTPSGGDPKKPAVVYLDLKGEDIDALVSAGRIVLAPELRGLGHSKLYATSMRAMLVGRTIAGMQTTDLLAAFEYLASRPDVDAKHIGIFAKGNAAAVALFAAALEPRIEKVACEGGPISYLDIVRAPIHDEIADLIVPGVLKDFDLPEVAAAIAPRPVWLVNPRIQSGVREEYKPAENLRSVVRPTGSAFEKVYKDWL